MKLTALETRTGKMLDYAAPRPEDLDLESIAHALGQTCRFGGHTSRFYSVADHSILVHDIVVAAAGTRDVSLAKAALFHDAHEAFLGDLPTPMKVALGKPYRKLQLRLDTAIAEAFDIHGGDFTHPGIKAADRLALMAEASRLMGPNWRAQFSGWVDLPEGVHFPPVRVHLGRATAEFMRIARGYMSR